ncbi:MAG: carbohydrate-binding protein [Verrucomicrobiota bacterium]
MRKKILDALALDSRIRDVNVGNFDNNNWMNYTRTWPSGDYNVYTRAAFGGTTGNATLEEVTSGVGTPVQTTNTLGSFTLPNTGGWQSYAWVPLRDAGGNLVRVTLGGLKTLRLSARANGGGNNNFLMLVTANTNLPSISNVYPNGTNMFQPSPTFSFNASSPIGATINATAIKLQVTITTVLTTVTTNITSTNGLVITGTASAKSVSYALQTNATYNIVASVTDANGSPASTTAKFDTYNPVFVWEAEDYDYGNGQYLDNAPTAGYVGVMGTAEVDYHDNVVVSQNGTPVYRTSDPVGLETVGDAPLRTQFISTGFADYDVGWYDNGNWNNYTRTFPGGQYNVFIRAANGSGGNGGITLARVTSGVGTTTQTTTNLGTMTIPATGGWQTYTSGTLRDTGGNLVKFAGGGVQTLRATSSGGVNANFYALFPANTNLPIITSVYPNGAGLFQATNRLSFVVTSSAGVSSSSITVVLDGTTLTNLVLSGNTTAWNVSYTNLTPKTTHTAVISAVDINGNSASTTVNFDTFSASYFTWEAEDYDHDGGLFTDNPQINAYTNLPAVADVDFHDSNTGGTLLYRPSGTATEVTADLARSQFTGAFDYNIGFFGNNEWGNYTRTYPAGTYNVWGRFAAGGGETTALLSQVTGGWSTTSQTTNYLGTFSIENSGWGSFTWVPLRDDNGNLVSVTFNGATNTLKLARGATGPDANVNFLMLAPALGPVTLTATLAGANVNVSFPTQSGYTYQIEYKNNLTDPTWTNLGSAVTGDGTVKIVADPASGSRRFYRARIQ